MTHSYPSPESGCRAWSAGSWEDEVILPGYKGESPQKRAPFTGIGQRNYQGDTSDRTYR